MTTHTVTIKVELSKKEYQLIKKHIGRRGEKIQSWTRRAIVDKIREQDQNITIDKD